MPSPTIAERVEAARRHLEMSIAWKGETLAFWKHDAITPITLKDHDLKNTNPYGNL